MRMSRTRGRPLQPRCAHSYTFVVWFWVASITLDAGPLYSATPYSGADSCRPCHPAEYAAQSASAHAHALAPSHPPQPGEWAFGAGSQAVTFVHHRDPDTYLELGQSW